MAELIFLGQSFYLRMTLTSCISGPVGFSDSKTHTAPGPGIASIFAVIRKSDHAQFLTGFRSNKGSGTKSSRKTCNLEVMQEERQFPAFIHAQNTACGCGVDWLLVTL